MMPTATTVRPIAPELDLDAIATLENDKYNLGYSEGYAHGSLHGTFEGRRLGAEKGFELWNELGAMESFARTWLRLLNRPTSQSGSSAIGSLDGQPASLRKRVKQVQQLESLLTAIDALPMDNVDAELDIGAALERIRAKYKLVCFSLGVSADIDTVMSTLLNDISTSRADSGQVIVVKGRRVDTTQLSF